MTYLSGFELDHGGIRIIMNNWLTSKLVLISSNLLRCSLINAISLNLQAWNIWVRIWCGTSPLKWANSKRLSSKIEKLSPRSGRASTNQKSWRSWSGSCLTECPSVPLRYPATFHQQPFQDPSIPYRSLKDSRPLIPSFTKRLESGFILHTHVEYNVKITEKV